MIRYLQLENVGPASEMELVFGKRLNFLTGDNDPFKIEPDTFVLNLASGKIKPNPELTLGMRILAYRTIKRLKLNDPETSEMRARHYTDYISGEITGGYLRGHSPFVWYEANRQRLL